MPLLVRYGWVCLLAATTGEMVVPFLLAPFYKGYRHTTDAISTLGNANSPVRAVFRLWMFAAGALLLLGTPALYHLYSGTSRLLSIFLVLFLGLFAVGACLFSCFFSVNETKDVVTTASQIHGIGSAIGFMLLLFVPLFIAILSYRMGAGVVALVAGCSFVLALASFVLFVMADKPAFQNTCIAKEGLWQRLTLLFMYLPLAVVAVTQMKP